MNKLVNKPTPNVPHNMPAQARLDRLTQIDAHWLQSTLVDATACIKVLLAAACTLESHNKQTSGSPHMKKQKEDGC